jgi:hypothetical protein
VVRQLHTYLKSSAGVWLVTNLPEVNLWKKIVFVQLDDQPHTLKWNLMKHGVFFKEFYLGF